MAINIDHTNSSNITLRGPSQGSPTDVINFVFPNTVQSEASLLISGDASLSAIAGLIDALDTKVNNSSTGSAALVNTGVAVGEIPVLNNDGKLDDSLIPSIAIKDTYVVADKAEALTLGSARIGDLAIATTENKNYILSSNDPSVDADWKEIVFPTQAVVCVNGMIGDVVLDGEDINTEQTVDGNTSTFTVSNFLGHLWEEKANTSSLTDYVDHTSLGTCLDAFVTDAELDSCVCAYYVTCSAYSDTLSNYYSSATIDSCLLNYAQRCETGSAAGCTVGTAAGNLVAVGNDGKIEASLLPALAITDTFVIATSGDLTTLAYAEKGDIAIATTDLKSFILCGNCYSNASDWTVLSTTFGTISCVNGKTGVAGSVYIDSCDISVVGSSTAYDGCTVSYALGDLDSRIGTIEGDYLTTQESTDLLACYQLSADASTTFGTKSDVGHTHVISDVTDLCSCLSSISTFFTGVGSYSATQNASNPLMNEACGSHSVALGYGAKALQDYEVAHAASWFTNVGDAQSSKIVTKGTTASNDFSEVSTLTIDSASVLFFKVDMVGYGSGAAAFRIEGATNSSALLNNVSVTTFADSNETIAVNAVHCGTYVSFQASGETSMNWVSSINTVKIK
jgi:hypothetical protein